ncbi:MAG: hypothetical protein IJG13_04635 [Kiritimatiellae bacterium]|nr:hypothetical protein [Kiritimatiellia bacterium]MBQ6330384.1 hypothetical protein [Kiritimatiellia bacterium]
MSADRSGTVSLATGATSVPVTGLNLEYDPDVYDVSVVVKKPSAAADITATYGELTADGFTATLSAAVPSDGYVLSWKVELEDSWRAPDVLSVGYRQLVKAVADFLGYDTSPNGNVYLTEAQRLKIDQYINSGIRQFYYPPKMDGVDENFEWSFLRMDCSVTTKEGAGDYALPFGFGRVAGNIYFDGDDSRLRPLAVVSVADVLNARRRGDTGVPRLAAFKSITPGRPPCGNFSDEGAYNEGDIEGSEDFALPSGQRTKIMLAPIPDRAYTLRFSAEADTGPLKEHRPFPLGGAMFSELIIESCLAIAEQRANDESGQHTEKFRQLLISGIARDRKTGATVFGQMGDKTQAPTFGRPVHLGGFKISYRDQTW